MTDHSIESFKILATFTKSFDHHHGTDVSDGSNNKMHLIASTVLIRDNLDILNIFNNIYNSETKYIIIEVSEYNEEIINLEILNQIQEENNIRFNIEDIKKDKTNLKSFYNINDENLTYMKFTFNQILKYFNFRDNETNSLIFFDNKKDEHHKIFYNKTLFIFNNITWSNIIQSFKLQNIHISGGSTNTRHMLTTSDLVLNKYLTLIYNYNYDYIMELCFKSYKNEKKLLSGPGQIPLELYKQYITNIEELNKLEKDEILEKLKILKSSENYSYNRMIAIIANNILICRNIIIERMSIYYEYELITKLKEKLEITSNKLIELENKYDVPPIYSRKETKRLKKEMNKNLKNEVINFNIHYKQIDKYKLEEEELNKKLIEKESEYIKYIETLKNISLIELFNKYDQIKNRLNDDDIQNSLKKKYYKKNKYHRLFSNINNMARHYSTQINLNNRNILKKQEYIKSSSFYLLLLNYFGVDVLEGQETVVQYIMSIASLSLLGLLCLINIMIYLLVIYSINKYGDVVLENKYPKLKWIINRYKKVSLWFLIYEFILLFSIILIVFVSSIVIIHQMLNV